MLSARYEVRRVRLGLIEPSEVLADLAAVRQDVPNKKQQASLDAAYDLLAAMFEIQNDTGWGRVETLLESGWDLVGVYDQWAVLKRPRAEVELEAPNRVCGGCSHFQATTRNRETGVTAGNCRIHQYSTREDGTCAEWADR